MIVCSCNVVTTRQIKAAVEELVADDPDVVLTPGVVYRALGVRPQCGTCLPQVVEMIHAHRETLNGGADAPDADDAGADGSGESRYSDSLD
jgi:bacterioferritin-associated ferredoxin